MILGYIDDVFDHIKQLENEKTNQNIKIKGIQAKIEKLDIQIKNYNTQITEVERKKDLLNKERENLRNEDKMSTSDSQSLTVQTEQRESLLGFIRKLLFGQTDEKKDNVISQYAEKQDEKNALDRKIRSYEDEKRKYEEEIKKCRNEQGRFISEENEAQQAIEQLEESIQKTPEGIRQLYNNNKGKQRKKRGDLKSRGIESFEELNNILGQIVIGEDDLRELNKGSQNKGRKNALMEYFIFKTLNSINLSSEENDTYYINTEKMKKTSKIAIIVPMSEVKSDDVVAFDSDNIILTDEFAYPQGTVCLISKKDGVELREKIRQDPKFSNVIVIEYEGDEIGEYPRCLVKLLEGNDPKNWNRDMFIKRYPYLKDAKDNYFQEQAVNNILQLIEKLKGCEFSKYDYFLLFLNSLMEKNGLGTEEMFKRALLSEKRERKEQIEYIVGIIKDKGYEFSNEGIKVIIDIFCKRNGFSEIEANKIDQTGLISNIQYKEVVVRNMRNHIRMRDSQISENTMLKNIFLGIFSIDNGFLNIEKEASEYYGQKLAQQQTKTEIYDWMRFLDEEDDTETRDKKPRTAKRSIPREPKKEIRKSKLYYSEEYIGEVDSWLDKIVEICKNPKLEISVNWGLKDGISILSKTMKNINKMDELSQSLNVITFKDKSRRIIGYPLKKRLDWNELNKKNTYLRQKESRIVPLVRMISVSNRLAHSYNYTLENYIFDFFYGDNPNLERIEVIKSREFKEIAQVLQNYCVINKEASLSLKSINDSWNQMINSLHAKTIAKSPTQDFLNSISQLIDLRDRCYEAKNELILYTIPKMKEANKKKPGAYSYGVIQTNIEETGKTDNVLYINLPGYGQFGFHIISPEILECIDSEYDSELPIIKSDYDQKKGKVQPPIPTMGLSEELNDYIQQNGLNILLNQIAENGEEYEMRRKDIFNVLLNYGKPIDEIKKALKIFDNQYGGKESRD